MRFPHYVLLAAALAATISGCVPVVAGGAAVGGSMAADRRTSGAYVEDEAIEWKAKTQLNNEFGYKAHINTTSFNRNVLLTGEAIDAATRARAEEIVRGIPNVRSVTNEIQIGENSSLSSRSNDTYLTGKVKAKFVNDQRFQANFVKVVTENSVVYLMGMVTRREAEAAAEIASSTEGVTKVVKVFEYVVEQ